jgi:uncharacterized protein YndB with AHSA1/START domain
MLRVETSVQINRPVTEVFNYMADPTKWPEWNSIVEESRPSETPLRVGTKIHQRAKFLGRKIESTFEVLEYEPNKRLVNQTSDPFLTKITSTFEPEGGGTRVGAVIEGEPGGFFKLGEPILARIAKKQFQAQLDTVKELLEAQVPVER